MVAGLLMFATNGKILSRMTCLVGGHSIWGIGLLEECCPEHEEGEQASIMAQCCEIGQAGQQVSACLGHSGPDLVDVEHYMDAAPITLILQTPAPEVSWLESRPPPADGGCRLATLGFFLI